MKTKITNTILLSALISFALLLGSGCSKKIVDQPLVGPDGAPLSGGTDINYPPAESTGYSESTINNEGTLDDTGVALQGEQKGNLSVNKDGVDYSDEYKKEHGRSSVGLQPIYFEFDQASILPSMAERMADNATFLKQIPGSGVVIEGNCDERGTNEYNLALGERRALNAKAYLVNLGVEANRIRTIGYGEERPLFHGQDEFSHAQNRRDDFILE